MPKRGAGLETDNKIILSSKGRCLADLRNVKECKGYQPRNENPQPESCVWLDEWDFLTCHRFEV